MSVVKMGNVLSGTTDPDVLLWDVLEAMQSKPALGWTIGQLKRNTHLDRWSFSALATGVWWWMYWPRSPVYKYRLMRGESLDEIYAWHLWRDSMEPVHKSHVSHREMQWRLLVDEAGTVDITLERMEEEAYARRNR